MTTKINYKEPEFYEIEKIRKEVRNNINKYSQLELDVKISEINLILSQLKLRKYNSKHNYKMKNLTIEK